MSAELTRQIKARQLRYKKTVLEEFNLESIQFELSEICETCEDIRYIAEGDEVALISALDGDEEEAYEFRMGFSELSAECERLSDLLSEDYICENFNDFLVGVSDGSGLNYMGYDTYEEDYYRLVSCYDQEQGIKEAKTRLKRLTKDELLDAANRSFLTLLCFLNVRYKYDYLKAAFDILKGDNSAFLDSIRQIEKSYDELSSDWEQYEKEREFDKLVSSLPPRVWVE